MKLVKFLAISFLAMGTHQAMAQTAEDIIKRHVEAIGGEEAWKKVNSVVISGNLQVQGTDVTVTTSILHGKGMRLDLSLMGMNGYQIVTPTEGWTFMPFQGQTEPAALSKEELAFQQGEIDAQGTFIDYKTKGHTIEYLGKENVNGVEAYKMKTTLKGGKSQTLFIDPTSYHVLRTITVQRANGQDVEQTVNLANYQKLPEGIVIPFSIGLPFGDLTVTKVEVNKTLDENIFKLPK